MLPSRAGDELFHKAFRGEGDDYLADDVAARYISGAELKVDAGWLNM